jgi:hypothetical protein
MKPHRLALTHNLILHYGLWNKMEVGRCCHTSRDAGVAVTALPALDLPAIPSDARGHWPLPRAGLRQLPPEARRGAFTPVFVPVCAAPPCAPGPP